jgi:hypothetical protein
MVGSRLTGGASFSARFGLETSECYFTDFNSFPTILRDKWQRCVISTSFAVAHNIYGPGLGRLLVMLGRRS